ncbi:MAG: low molecular weight phosphotyrosine protein phosphatase [Erysipelotrichaceae bacterium]|nr:low molecular weight phosphotyrosine protein phosphatase [Erysipelotrichaceae bacterium]
MISILFVCHGNICRSPMAEFIMKKMVSDDPQLSRMDIRIASAATSYEETGNDLYPYAKAKLREKGIPFERHRARTLIAKDYETYDLLIGMDDANIRNMCRMYGESRSNADVYTKYRNGQKIFCLPEFHGSHANVADPWYTDDFETAYRDIEKGCEALKEFLKKTIV